MSQTAIHVECISKLYRLGERQRYTGLRHLLEDAVRAPQAVAALESMTDEPLKVRGSLVIAALRKPGGAIVEAVRRLDRAAVG